MPPWAAASISISQSSTPPKVLAAIHSSLVYEVERPAQRLAVITESQNYGGILHEREINIVAPRPELLIKAWSLNALMAGIIREAYRYRSDVDGGACRVDIVQLDAPIGVEVPPSPLLWDKAFIRVHANHCPTVSVTLALPTKIQRAGNNALRYVRILNLVALEPDEFDPSDE